MTTKPHTWTIGPIDQRDRHAGGAATSLADAWLDALTAGHAALVAGDLDTLAVHIDDELEALHTPGRDDRGEVDAASITQALLSWYQDAVAADVIARITGGSRTLWRRRAANPGATTAARRAGPGGP